MAATKRVVDLTNVKEGGGNFRPKRKPEGDYKGKIAKVDDHQPKDTTKPLGWVYTIMVDGDARSTYPYYVNPSPKEAWKIARISEAAGFKITGKRVNFDPNKLVGKPIGILLEDDEYEGKPKSSIGEVFPVSEVGANADEPEDIDLDEDETEIPDDEEIEEEEEVAPPPRKRTARKAPEPEPEEEEEYEEEEEPEPTPPPRKRTARKPAPVVEPEDDEEEEEVVETKPVRRRAPAKTAAAAPVKRTRPKPAPVEEDDDLDDLDVDELD
jgi:hypothetical protein